MQVNEQKERVQQILNYKTIYPNVFDELINLLEKIENSDPYFAHINRGKALLLNNDLEYAEIEFEKALGICEEASVYYYLYKVMALKKEYEKGSYYLTKCQETAKKANIIYDVSLQKKILEAINNIELGIHEFANNYKEIEFSNNYASYKITNDELLKLYKKIVEAYNNIEYENMLNLLKEAQSLINKEKISIEFKTLIASVEELQKKFNYMIINENENKYKIVKMSYEEYLSNLINELQSFKKTKLECLQIINFYIETNLILAKFLLEGIREHIINSHDLEFYYLTNKIKEKEQFNELNDVQKESYTMLKEMGSINYKENKLDEAYDTYVIAYNITKHPIFLYYIGKILYKKSRMKKL